MSNIFNKCSSLSLLPDISVWNIINVKNMNYMFNKCSSLSVIPDISKWNINIESSRNNEGIFNGCLSLAFSPDKFIRKISSGDFYKNSCKDCLSLEDI